jgi:hypothetical protein
MAKSNTSETATARMLSGHGHLKNGNIVVGDAKVIAALVAAGIADDNPESVAYAASIGGVEVSTDDVPEVAAVPIDEPASTAQDDA